MRTGQAAALVALATDHGFAQWQAVGAAFGGWVVAEQGRAVEGIARIEDRIEAYRATGAALFLPYSLALLGTTYGVAGRAAEGLRFLAEALDPANATGEHWFQAELHRLKGELLRSAASDRGTTEARFLRAMSIAREQNANVRELRAATSLARLWAGQGKRAEARNLLVPIYGWFTESFDTADLQHAKALLDGGRWSALDPDPGTKVNRLVAADPLKRNQHSFRSRISGTRTVFRTPTSAAEP